MTSTSRAIFTSSMKLLVGGNRRNNLSKIAKSYHTLRTLSPTVNGNQNKILTFGANYSIRNLRCYKCETELDEKSKYSLLVCSKCQSLQKLQGSNVPNYYELLGHPKTYRVDVNSLSSRVKNLQKKLHPDLYAQKGKEEQELSQELSSLVNKAFGTLSHPIERAQYLLTLYGVKDPEGDSERQRTSDPTFLEEVMDLNEQLVEISSEKDWMEFRRQNEITLEGLAKKLEDAFEKEMIPDAVLLIGRMRYYDTLQEKLKEVKSKLGIVE